MVTSRCARGQQPPGTLLASRAHQRLSSQWARAMEDGGTAKSCSPPFQEAVSAREAQAHPFPHPRGKGPARGPLLGCGHRSAPQPGSSPGSTGLDCLKDQALPLKRHKPFPVKPFRQSPMPVPPALPYTEVSPAAGPLQHPSPAASPGSPSTINLGIKELCSHLSRCRSCVEHQTGSSPLLKVITAR